jgi:poly(glycerol-phosphate) alpha-glucosyltransferase
MGPASIGFAPDLKRKLRESDLDILHLHGIWMYPSKSAADWAMATGHPYIVSPHGMLDPWILSRGRWKKRLAGMGYERRSWSAATAFHALTLDEAADIERVVSNGQLRPITHVIPNPAPLVCSLQPSRSNMILYLGRVHAKKNIESLIAAYGAEQRPSSGSQLLIAGWGTEDDISRLREQISVLDRPDIRFLGPVFGSAKEQLIAQARFLALPSLSEGLPMAILEAWAHGTPTIMSGACHLNEGFAAGAAIDSGTDLDSIRHALKSAFSLEVEQWEKMSAHASTLAKDVFSLSSVATRWGDVYSSLLHAGDADERRAGCGE